MRATAITDEDPPPRSVAGTAALITGGAVGGGFLAVPRATRGLGLGPTAVALVSAWAWLGLCGVALAEGAVRSTEAAHDRDDYVDDEGLSVYGVALEATRRRRLLRRAATKMRLRLASAAFESWLEYARMRRESRAERRLRDLEKRAEQAEALEMEARRAKAAAAAKAAETASLVADAEAREARARREVEAMRSRGKASGKASGSASSDSES